jgi:hypothetical protein
MLNQRVSYATLLVHFLEVKNELRFAGCFLTHTFWNGVLEAFRRFIFIGIQPALR